VRAPTTTDTHPTTTTSTADARSGSAWGRSTSLRGVRCIRVLTDAITGRPRTNRRAAPVGRRLVSVFGLPYGGSPRLQGRTLIGTAVQPADHVGTELKARRRRDFPPHSLRPTLGRAGRAGTGGDAQCRPKLSTGRLCTSRAITGTV